MKSEKIEINFYSLNLAGLLEELDKLGISKKDFKNLNFELDYSGCYYESDTPKIILVGEIKNGNQSINH